MTYARAADYYDLLYAWKDYAAEAALIRDIIAVRQPAARTLLDVACGTGQHLTHLRAWYEVAGVDAEPRLLDVARGRLPGVPLHEADMRDFDIGDRFDVVTCLFSSIGYMHTPDDLARAIAAMARHLRPGGVLIVEPWLSPQRFDPAHIGGPTVGKGDQVAVVRMNSSRVEGRLSVMDFHYLVGRPGTVEYVTETHALALYTDEEYSAAFASAGLAVEHDPEGPMDRGLWIGVKRKDRPARS